MKAKFTKRQCRQLVDAFRKTRAVIEPMSDRPNHHAFICLALEDLADEGEITDETALLAQTEVIEARLNGAYTLNTWLVRQGAVDEREARNDPEHHSRVNQHRLAWLDLLIKEFSDLAEVAS
jgi:hypothetical protein